MQAPVKELINLGQLPGSDDPDVSKLKGIQEAIDKIQQPISDSDAYGLVKLFGSDDCFGLAWTLLHIIETAPGWPIEECLKDLSNEWVVRLKERAEKQ